MVELTIVHYDVTVTGPVFIHILQGYCTGTGAILWLPQCQWSNPEGYGRTWYRKVAPPINPLIWWHNHNIRKYKTSWAYIMEYNAQEITSITHVGCRIVVNALFKSNEQSLSQLAEKKSLIRCFLSLPMFLPNMVEVRDRRRTRLISRFPPGTHTCINTMITKECWITWTYKDIWHIVKQIGW